jgi:2-oxoglutarate ferredoxin oxidoreductase subunit alpha
MARICLKIVGASGQGINSVGEVLAKGLKRGGYCVFGYREYPSLIKGGHASYQLDISEEEVSSTERTVHILVSLNHHGLLKNLPDLREGSVLVHDVPSWKFPKEAEEMFAAKHVTVVCFPTDELLAKLNAKPILGNILLSSFLWAALGRPMDELKAMVAERFAKKKDLLELNMKCIEEGYRFTDPKAGPVQMPLPAPQDKWKDHLLLTASHAVALGAVHAGVRFYAGYPMTPSSPVLSYIADVQNRTGMAVKQAEDEITAAQMISGAAFMGTRALTATSGGGFDLMTETVSLNGLVENAPVFILAQRPGPATGLPTWTAQGDLLLAVNAAHGEFPRCVIGVADTADGFSLMPEAFNLAEEYQTPVIVLTDKQNAEALYTQAPYDQTKTRFSRGRLVTDAAQLASLKPEDRYDPSAPDGVSARWLPGGGGPAYCGQGDEHDGAGNSIEGADNANAQMEKRMKKFEALAKVLPEPELFGRENPDILLVGWGSTKSVVIDAMRDESLKGVEVSYLHFTYLWPLKTERFAALARSAKRVVLVEGNHQGQLGMLLRQQSGIAIPDRILKFNGRPFFRDELLERLASFLPAKAARRSPARSPKP